MKPIPDAITTATRAAIALGLLALAGHAGAADLGSTDTWGNQFPGSFGAATVSKSLSRFNTYRNGSTDAWDNRFRESFGSSEAGATSRTVGSTGSTDIWSNGFRESFEAAPFSASAGLIARSGEVGQLP